MWTCLVLTNVHVWKYLAHHAQRTYYVPVSSSYRKTSQNLKNPNTRSPLQGKIPTSKGSWFAIRHYISTRPSLFSRTQKIPNSFTIDFLEISHSLTSHSEGFWSVPHWCLLFGPFVLFHRYPIGVIWDLQLTDDFSTSSIHIKGFGHCSFCQFLKPTITCLIKLFLFYFNLSVIHLPSNYLWQ